MGDERENLSTATSNILLRNDEELAYWCGDGEDSSDFYTTEAGIQKKVWRRIMPNYLKKWVLKEENNSRDSMGRRGI